MNIFLLKYFIVCVCEVFIILSELFWFFVCICFNEFVLFLNVVWVNEGFDLFDLILIIFLYIFCLFVICFFGEFFFKLLYVVLGEFNFVFKIFFRGKFLRMRLGWGCIKFECEVWLCDKWFGFYLEIFVLVILIMV